MHGLEVAGPSGGDGVAGGAAVLLHPHPAYGGDRHHPFVAGLFSALPAAGFVAARFDFGSSDVRAAGSEVRAAIDAVAGSGPVVLCGYSFGAGLAATVDASAVAGWFLVAPVASMLADPAVVIGGDPRPKLVLAPTRDQISPPGSVAAAVVGWTSTTVVDVDDDHFLWDVLPSVVPQGVAFVDQVVSAR